MKNFHFKLFIAFAFFTSQGVAQNNTELQLSLSNFKKVYKQGANSDISCTITSSSDLADENVMIHYAIDEQLIASQDMHLNIGRNKPQEHHLNYTFDLSATMHHLKIWLSDAGNHNLKYTVNTIDTEFLVGRTTVPQLPLIEEFTSSTCAPCASFNSTFDPFLASINANENGGQVAAVKFQMNWPSPDDDPSYNSDGNGRRTYYAVNSIPKSYLNGVATSTFNQAVIDDASGESAFELTPYFYLSGDTVKVTCTAKSYTTITSSVKMLLALTEDFYTYTGGSTSQTTFHYVMRKMLPTYAGTILGNVHDDTTYTVAKNYKVNYGNVVQNSYNIWGTSAGFTIVAWVQNTATKEVYQAGFANTPSAIGMNEPELETPFEIFPNPANQDFTLKLELKKASHVNYTLCDIHGKLVQDAVSTDLGAGRHILATSTQDLAPGIYVCKLETNEGRFTKKVVVAK